MKKLSVIIILGLIFSLLSCSNIVDQKPGTITAKNTSTNFNVSYVLENKPEAVKVSATTTIGGTQTYILPLYTYLTSYENAKRLLYKTEYPGGNDITYTFFDRASYKIEVTLHITLSENVNKEITLSADGWMDNIVIAPSTANDVPLTNPGWLIYTDTPEFKAVIKEGKSATVSKTLVGDTFKVEITG